MGFSFGESAYMSMSVLSWQMTVVGDPLYRPFKHSLQDQIHQLQGMESALFDWASVRMINLLLREGRFNTALQLCRAILRERDNLIVKEKLADLYALNNVWIEAGQLYEELIEEAETPETAVRVAARWSRMLRMQKQEERAEQMEQQVKDRWEESPTIRWLDRFRAP